MSMRNRLAAVVLCAGTLSGVAYAQPTLTEDLGALPTNTLISRPITLSGAQVFWYKITIPDITANSGAGQLFLDIRTNVPDGGAINDHEIALFAASGAFATGVAGTSSDDDDGPGTCSALSYGATCPTRANLGAGTQTAGIAFNGRDGSLAAGDYYLVVAPYNAAFATNFGVTPGSQNGNINLEIRLGTTSSPALTTGVTNPVSVSATTTTLITATANTTCVNAPTSVSVNLTGIGGPSAAAMFDNGTNGDVTAGDNVWSLLTTVPAASPSGARSLIATAQNSEGSSSIDIPVIVIPAPATLSASGGVYSEVEDNDTKPRSNRILSMASGEALTGATTGTSTSTAGAGSADYFRIATAAAPLGIYRHRLAITNTGGGTHTATIRGLSQSTGVITQGGDSEIQATTSSVRLSQWYGFGKNEMVYYRVVGSSSTTGNYVSTLTSEPVTPAALGSFVPGELTITTIGQNHTTDTEMWIYDANLDPIANFGNDDESTAEGGTGALTQSQLRRTFAPGTYYMMLSNYNTANNLPSPSTDDFRSGNVMDFAGTAANSQTTTVANMAFAIVDANGAHQFPATKDNAFDIYWATFTVGNPAPTCGTSDFNGDGDFGTDSDIEAWFACLAGDCCSTCFVGGSDFNMDGDFGTDADIEAFFRVLAGGNC